jgi:hypothetical protein
MSALQKRTLWLGALLITTLSGCEVVDCDEKPEADICQPDPEEDAGDEGDLDGAVSDGGTTSDGGRDGGAGDGGGRSDAGPDGGSDGGSDAAATTLSIPDFCVAQLATAVAWRDGLEGLCGTTTSSTDRDTFLLEVFAYPKEDAQGNAEDKCIKAREAAVNTGNTTFDGTKAQACADAFLTSFDAPPDPFPTDGIDLAMYEAKVAHGAPTLIQTPECRAAFKGTLTRGKACTDHFECADGLRCLEAPGGGKACENALVGGTCAQSSQCADGYTCVGATGGAGRTCVKRTELPLNGGNCSFSLECGEGLICNASGKCANPAPQVICKP